MKKSGKLTEVENLYQNVFPILSNYSSIQKYLFISNDRDFIGWDKKKAGEWLNLSTHLLLNNILTL